MRKFAIVIALSLLLAGSAWAGNGVLLVDDDLSGLTTPSFPNIQTFFTDALEDAGFTQATPAEKRGEYDIFEVNTMGDGPDLATMQQYEAVIWFTGTTCCSTGCLSACITPNDEANLGAYLDGGGKLFLSAQDYLERYPDGAVTPGTFAYDYLKVAECYSDVWQGTGYVAQGAGSVTDELVFELQNPFAKDGQDLYMDNLVLRSSKEQFMNEFYISGPPSGYAAISYSEGDMAGQDKVFFTTICFAALKDGAQGTKAELMGLMMAWMLGDYADYGDAPDPTYCSYFENDGARHINSEEIYEWLGASVDLEFNTWQSGDLYDDGVVFNTPFVPGDMGSVDVTVSVSTSDWLAFDPDSVYRYYEALPWGGGEYFNLYLTAWCDWNQDGDWVTGLPGGDCIINNMEINPIVDGWTGTSHTYNISFPVPADAGNNDMWCRFRLAWDDDVHFYYDICGYKSFGEVEDYVLGSPLSVGLSTFYASAGDGQATLYWSTQSEVNNLGFYLLRSEDGANYERVNQELISGQGTSEVRHDYRYVDKGLVNGVTYNYKVVDVDMAGVRTSHGPIQVTPQASSGVPSEYALSQNYPNPFNAQTAISYAIPTASHVSLKVFNVLGEEVRTLVDADQQASTYQVTWDGRDAGGKQVASGVYFCKLQAGSFEGSTKMVFMK
jgi:hypothetical protein